MTLGIPLKVVETPFWTIFVNFTDKPLEYFDVYNRNWTMSPQALDRMLELSKTYKDIYHVGGGIKKVVSYSGHEITKGDVILLTVVFQDDASAEFRAEKYVFLFGGENKGFRLLASSNLEITRENFDRILDIVLNKPMEVKQCAVIGPLWYK